jgi:membrane associated rhomboid family serine protease
MGHFRFLIFYLVAGAAAALAQVWASPASPVPMVGASGAIAGVMGAYLVMFPRSRIHVLVFLVFVIDIVEIPAVFFLGLWFVMQIFGGIGSVAATGDSGGVAFWAHIGGFAAGLLTVRAFRRRDPQRRAPRAG